MPLGEFLRVTLRGIGKASHWALAEEEAKHATDVTSTDLWHCKHPRMRGCAHATGCNTALNDVRFCKIIHDIDMVSTNVGWDNGIKTLCSVLHFAGPVHNKAKGWML